MRRLLVSLACCLIALGMVACTNAAVESPDEVRITEERASPIIIAINTYTQDHNQLPKQLDVLVPTYLREIPKTATGQNFAYHLASDDGYDLCYPYRSRGNCCYLPRFKRWDCIHDIPPE